MLLEVLHEDTNRVASEYRNLLEKGGSPKSRSMLELHGTSTLRD